MLSCGRGETHVSRFLSAMGADPPSKGCLRSREREVGHEPSTESTTSVSSTTNISGSIDVAWQCHGSGRSYKSLSSHLSVIGEKPGKVLKFAIRKKSCHFCETAERCGRPAPKHDCRKRDKNMEILVQKTTTFHFIPYLHTNAVM